MTPPMTPDEARSIRRLPFQSTKARVPARRAGTVMDGLHDRWHVIQLFNFRLVVMWPAREHVPRPPEGPEHQETA